MGAIHGIHLALRGRLPVGLMTLRKIPAAAMDEENRSAAVADKQKPILVRITQDRLTKRFPCDGTCADFVNVGRYRTSRPN